MAVLAEEIMGIQPHHSDYILEVINFVGVHAYLALSVNPVLTAFV